MRPLALTAVFLVVIMVTVELTTGPPRVLGVAAGLQATTVPDATPEPTLDAMTEADVVVIRTAKAMEAGADVLEERANASGDPALEDLARQWRSDAKTLLDPGVWLLLSTSSDSMVHDPDTAHELNLENLKANGEVMVTHGKAMIAHGTEMTQKVVSLRDSGVLAIDLADQLTTSATDLVTDGELLEREGKELQDYAERMLRSIGR